MTDRTIESVDDSISDGDNGSFLKFESFWLELAKVVLFHMLRSTPWNEIPHFPIILPGSVSA
jgi:hypothetical protein